MCNYEIDDFLCVSVYRLKCSEVYKCENLL